MAINKEIRFALLFVWLICSGNTIDWQATGNMTQSNMTVIWNYIRSKFDASKTYVPLVSTQRNYMPDFAANLSSYLNNQWNQAWNVVIAYVNLKKHYDSVLYGYAFRDHWMWFNGYGMAEQKSANFIIWKDYNCHTWLSFSNFAQNSTSSFSKRQESAISDMIDQIREKVDLNQIWLTAKLIAQSAQKNAAFPGSAFTVIASQSEQSYYAARVCALGCTSPIDIDGDYAGGSAFLIQMR